MKDTKNENGALTPEVPPSAENDDSRDWSLEERNQLLLREREARLEAEVMRDANLALTQDLSLERILETLLDYLRKLVPFDSANVMLVEGDSCFVTSAIKGYEDFIEDMGSAKANIFSPKTNALFGQICGTKQSLLVSDTKEEPRWQSGPGSEHIRNWIGVPLLEHDEIIGLYSLDKAQPGYFTPEHVRKAEVLAAQAGTAIRNARLFRQVQNYAAELELSIKERDREKSALRKAEKKYRDILNSVHEGVFQTTPEGRFITANYALARMLGFDSPDELIRTRTDIAREQYVDPDRREEFKRLLDSQGFVRNFEHEAYTKGGSTIWISENVRAVRDERGVVLHYEGTSQDVTERRRAEEALRESEARNRAILESALDCVITMDQEGMLVDWNPAAEKTFGHPRDKAIGVELAELIIPPRFREQHRRGLAHYLKTGEGPVLGKHLYLTALNADGAEFPIELAITRIELRGATMFTAYLRDITERKRAEEALRQSEVYFRSLIEHAADTISTYDANGVRLYTTPSIERVLGYKPEEMIGRSGFELLHPDDRPLLSSLFAQAVQIPGTTVTKELRCRHKDGSWRTLESTGSNLLDNPAVGAVILNSRDITERRRAEEALRESEERYRDLVENSRELICTHDLDGLILSANRAASEVLGYDLKDYCGKRSIRDILAPEVRHQFDEYMARLCKDRATSGIMLVQTMSGERRVWEYYNSLRTEGVDAPIVRGMARDITESKRAEDALRESESFRRTIVESEPESVKLVAPDYTLLDMNPAGLSMIGAVSKEQVVGCSVLSLIAPEWHNTFKQMHERVFQGESVVAEFEVIGLTGVRRWMETHAAPLRNRESNVIAQLAITRDITEQKRAEESLQLFRNLIDQSSDAIEVIDPITFRFIDCNESAYRSLGYSREEFLSLSVFDIDPLVDHSMMARLDEEMKESGLATLESLHLRKDGTTFPVEVNVKLVRLERDYRLAVVRDITSRKLAEEALRESEERYRELFENAKDAIYVHDLSGRYTSVNRAAEQLSGFTREEILGKHFSNFVSARDLVQVLCRKLDEENEPVYEVDLLTRSGQRVPVEISSRVIYENGVAVGVQGTARDITDRKRTQEALRMYSQRLIQAQETEREKIARELHDEIGQVLTAVRINLQSMQRSGRSNENAPRLDESIAIVDEALGRVRELSIELRPSLLDDLGLTAALRWYVDRYAQRTGIIAEVLNGFDEDGRLPRELETACFRIAQEALNNVARHAQAGSVSVQLERSRERMLLTIIDDGVGFDVDKLRKKAPAASTLGLRGMEERALAVGGHIEIDSGSGRGTRVRAIFPLKRR